MYFISNDGIVMAGNIHINLLRINNTIVSEFFSVLPGIIINQLVTKPTRLDINTLYLIDVLCASSAK